jgi:hypothetical protein
MAGSEFIFQVDDLIAGMEYLHSGEISYQPEDTSPIKPNVKYRVFHGDIKPVRSHDDGFGILIERWDIADECAG